MSSPTWRTLDIVMTTNPSARPAAEHQVAAAIQEMLPLVRQHIDEIGRQRRLPDVVEYALRATGINRMLLPASLGGWETLVGDAIEAIEPIAAVDGSTAWCAVIGAGSNVFAGYLPERGAREVFADPDRSSATMFAPLGTLRRVGDRLSLRGRWPFVSNCLHAEWIGLVANPEGVAAGPQLVFVRAESLTIEDTWDTIGLRGTGSHHVTASGVAVDPDHCCPFVGDAWPEAPLWRMPVFTVILPLLAAVPLGIARGALDEVARQVRDGRTGLRRGDLASDPLAMADYAAAELRLLTARTGCSTSFGMRTSAPPGTSRSAAVISPASISPTCMRPTPPSRSPVCATVSAAAPP
jgi:alkylation response protein AidB-like acyl-CoA dehydrogenase